MTYRERALKAYRAMRPCESDRYVVRWLHEQIPKVSRKTVYNWINDRVEIPAHAWTALERVEKAARDHLQTQMEGIGR